MKSKSTCRDGRAAAKVGEGLSPASLSLARKQRATVRSRILVVDEHPIMRMGVTALINGEVDMTVCGQAGQAEEAHREIQRCSPDLVITGIASIGGGGWEFLRDLKGFYPDLPVLVASTYDETLHAERALRSGARGYVMKDAGGEKLLEAIRKVLAGQVYVSQKMEARIVEIFSGHHPRGSDSPIAKLSAREFEVFQRIGQGQSTREIAQHLQLSPKTVEVHRGHIKEKLALRDSTSLIRHAVRWMESVTAEHRPGQM